MATTSNERRPVLPLLQSTTKERGETAQGKTDVHVRSKGYRSQDEADKEKTNARQPPEACSSRTDIMTAVICAPTQLSKQLSVGEPHAVTSGLRGRT